MVFEWSERKRLYLTLGLLRGNVVSVAHVDRGDSMRIISMRKATRAEKKDFFYQIAN